MQKKKPTVAIIGGGISGLTVSQLLQSEFDITLFEKARGLGGRLATTYNNDNCQYDIGARFSLYAFIAAFTTSLAKSSPLFRQKLI